MIQKPNIDPFLCNNISQD